MNLSLEETIIETRGILDRISVPGEQADGICDLLKENCMDSNTITETEFDTLKKAFPCIPLGYLLKIVNHFKQKAPPSIEVESDSDTVPLSESDISITSSSSISNDSSEILDDLSVVPNLSRPVPKEFPEYRFKFNYHGRETIRTGVITETGKRDITTALINALKHYERYPTPALRKMAVSTFIKIGKASLGLSQDEAMKFWLRKVTQKLNTQAKQQRKLSEQPTSSKRSYNNASGVANTNVLKRKKMTAFCGDSEEDMNISKEMMKEEFVKPMVQRNKKMISNKMKETCCFRHKFIVDNNPPAKDVFADWPALKVYDEIVSEFERLQPHVCASNHHIHKLGVEIMKSVLEHTLKKQQKSLSVQKVLEILPLDDSYLEENEDLIFVTGLQLLCCALKGNTKRKYDQHCYVVDFFPINTTVSEIASAIPDRLQPFLAVYGTAAQHHKITLFIDQSPILDVENIFKGVIAVMAYHYVLNYEYCQHVKKVMQFLQVYVFKLPIQKPDSLCSSVLELALMLKCN
uniref:Uncharacterized protein LOC104265813 n=1 Tax=Phallusia mammillata TaxID=59560 RepID=A0A6F9DIC0_9ASCI|nr:uncharacterized protein LOC104265813 [Phallusia mammillata]